MLQIIVEIQISVINTATNDVTATIPVGANPIGVSVSPDGSKVYIANQGANEVSVINSATNIVSDTIPVGNRPYAFGNFISTYIQPTACQVYFNINPDTSNSKQILLQQYFKREYQLMELVLW